VGDVRLRSSLLRPVMVDVDVMAMRAGRIDRLSALDRLMLWASKRWPQDIGALVYLDGTALVDPIGRFRIEAVREAIGARLHLAPRFRQVIRTPPKRLGGPLWMDASRVDLPDHVRVHPLPPGSGEAEVLDAIEEIRSRRLDRSRPLWEVWFLNGLPDGRIAMYVRLHHSLADGMAAMRTIDGFLDAVPDLPAATAPAWTPAVPPSGRELRADHVRRRRRRVGRTLRLFLHPWRTFRRASDAWPAVRELFAEKPADRTSLDRTVGAGRRLAVIRTSLEEVKKAAHDRGGTVNDVLLAATEGGLRELLRSRGEPTEDTTVRVYVPISMRHGGDGPQQGNQIAQMAIPLPLRAADPSERLRRIAIETVARKARTRTSMEKLLRGRLAMRLMLIAVMRQRVNATTASIPGPTEPRYLAGARVLEVVPLVPLVANEPLAVAALSYAGALTFGVVADRDAFPDLEVFATAMREELEALAVSTTPALVGSVRG
jgi:diacylglycerol O-acyltransferase